MKNNINNNKKIIKSPKHFFADLLIGKWKTRARFQQKILNPMIVEAQQNSQFLRQNTRFLKKNRVLSKFLYGVFALLD